MIHTETTSIKNAYVTNIRKILKHGKKVKDERGSNILEIQNLHTTIDFSNSLIFSNPFNMHLLGSVWNDENLVKYCEQMLDGEDKGFVYDYGNRLRGFDVDQIQSIIDRLNNCRESRRAVAVTYRPSVDYNREEIPCLIMIDVKIRDDFLTLTAVFRSNDMYGASYANLHGLYYLADYIKANLNRDVIIKAIECHHISAHIYESDIESAKELLELNGGFTFE